MRAQELNRTYDLTGDEYLPGPREADLVIVNAEPFESRYESEAIKLEFKEIGTDYTYCEIFSVKKHPDAKINGLLRAIFDTTDTKFKLKDLIGKTLTGYIYTKESGYKGVKFEADGDEF